MGGEANLVDGVVSRAEDHGHRLAVALHSSFELAPSGLGNPIVVIDDVSHGPSLQKKAKAPRGGKMPEATHKLPIVVRPPPAVAVHQRLEVSGRVVHGERLADDFPALVDGKYQHRAHGLLFCEPQVSGGNRRSFRERALKRVNPVLEEKKPDEPDGQWRLPLCDQRRGTETREYREPEEREDRDPRRHPDAVEAGDVTVEETVWKRERGVAPSQLRSERQNHRGRRKNDAEEPERAIPAATDANPDEGEGEGAESGKKRPLRSALGRKPSRVWRPIESGGGEVVPGRGGVIDDVLVAAIEPSLAVPGVGNEKRKAERGDGGGAQSKKDDLPAAEKLPAVDPERKPEENHGESEVDHVVVAGERLEKREDRDSRELPRPPLPPETQSTPEHEGEPLERQELQLEEVTETVGGGEEDRSRRQSGPSASGNLADEEVHPDTREHEGGENRDVVGERETSGHRENRPDEEDDPEEMLGEGQSIGTGKEDVGVEERKGIPGQDVKAPAKRPGVEKGVGRRAQRRRHARKKGPGQPEAREQEVSPGGGVDSPRSHERLSVTSFRPALQKQAPIG